MLEMMWPSVAARALVCANDGEMLLDYAYQNNTAAIVPWDTAAPYVRDGKLRLWASPDPLVLPAYATRNPNAANEAWFAPFCDGMRQELRRVNDELAALMESEH